MRTKRRLLSLVTLVIAVGVMYVPSRAWGIGFILSQSKEELKLKYDVEVQDHGTGRVTIVLTLEDEGRLRPLDEVQFVIPARKQNADGSYWMDLVVSIEMRPIDGGKKVGRVHILKDLAQRAEIQLNTHTMDGKLDPMTRLHHVIRIADYIGEPAPAAPEPKPERGEAPPARGAAATERR